MKVRQVRGESVSLVEKKGCVWIFDFVDVVHFIQKQKKLPSKKGRTQIQSASECNDSNMRDTDSHVNLHCFGLHSVTQISVNSVLSHTTIGSHTQWTMDLIEKMTIFLRRGEGGRGKSQL
jgi:hypothetical protein